MKFGLQFEQQQLQRWKEHYLQYDAFKRRIYEICKETESEGLLESNSGKQLVQGWHTSLSVEAARIGRFVNSVLNQLEMQQQQLSQTRTQLSLPCGCLTPDANGQPIFLSPSPRNASSLLLSPVGKTGNEKREKILELRLLKAAADVKRGGAELRMFSELNWAAFYNILKKADKMFNRTDGLTELLPKLITSANLDATSRLDSLEASLRQVVRDQRLPISVLQLVKGIGSHESEAQDPSVMPSRDRALFFFMGSAVSLLFAIIAFILVPIPNQHRDTFVLAYFLAPFPVFRVGMSIVLVLWGMGAVARACENNDINHMFVLEVDPRCRIGPRSLFASAAFLTAAWILIFGMYVVDYKWEVFPKIWASRSINSRSSLHFMFYPFLLIAAVLGVFLGPSAAFRYRYRKGIVKGVMRTLLAPFFCVSFGDNITGDVMTSLAKPLQEVPAALCYMFSHHPQRKSDVENFLDHGDNCHAWEHMYLVPCIAGLPFLNRSLQCLRRYHDTKQRMHLVNFGKYVSSLLVVVAAAMLLQDSGLVILVSITATAYAFAWDVMMDWGLSLRDFRLMCSLRHPQRSPGSLCKRSLPPWTYLICAVLDLIARLAWVNTLLPTTFLTHDIIAREVLKTFIIIVEIARRSMWSVLRIEWEQVANAGGFRALLWVPDRLSADLMPVEMLSIQ